LHPHECRVISSVDGNSTSPVNCLSKREDNCSVAIHPITSASNETLFFNNQITIHTHLYSLLQKLEDAFFR
jgi:hypothetical protein